MKYKTILFRTDSSYTIGTGHIMRDLVLASKYKDANLVFAVQDLDGNMCLITNYLNYGAINYEKYAKEVIGK